MDIQSIILGFLMEHSMTGYQLKNAFSLSFSYFSGISYGSIYPALKKMESLGFITTELKIQKNAPNKKVCSITEKGREKFIETLQSPLPAERYKSPFLSRLFFFSHLSPSERTDLANRYLGELSELEIQVNDVQKSAEKTGDPFRQLCFSQGARYIRDLKKNLEETLDALNVVSGQL